MAIINSLAVGKARNSAGNLTFSTIKGRTIAREKPAYVRNPQTSKQIAQREKMAKIVAAWRQFGYQVKHLFTVIAGYGSAYNQFVKLNVGKAETLVVDAITGKVTPIVGLAMGSGKYDSDAIYLSFSGSNMAQFNVSSSQLIDEMQPGDIFGVIRWDSTNEKFEIYSEELFEDQIPMLRNGNYLDTDVEVNVNDLYAGYWYSSARNLSSTPILKKREV